MDWWIWVVAGLACFIIELTLAGTFVFVFLGMAALVVGGLTGLGGTFDLWKQALAFALLAGLAVALFRPRLLKRLSPRKHPIDSVVGELALATEPIAVGAAGKAEYRGTVWQAHNMGPSPIAVGDRCRIARVDGLTLWLQDQEKA